MSPMDEFQAAWESHDRGLEATLRLNRRVLASVQLGRAKSSLGRLALFLGLEAAMWAVLVLWLGNYIHDHWTQLRFAWPGAAADLYCIGNLAVVVRMCALALRVDPARPVSAIQKQLETLRVLRIQATRWAVLGGTVVWVAFLVVALDAFLGVDAVRVLGLGWLSANVAFGWLLTGGSLWVSRRYADRMRRSAFLKRLLQELAGSELGEASAFLATLAEFGDEAPAR